MFITLGLLFLSICLLYELVCRYYFPRVNDNVPLYGRKLPVLGNMLSFTRDELYQTISSLGKFTLENGGVSKFFLGPLPCYVVADPEDVATVLNKCLEKSVVYKFIQPMLGKMLVAAEVPVWKGNRRIVELAYKQHQLDSYLEVFNDNAAVFVQSLAEEVGKGGVDLTDKLTKNILETTCQTIMGTNTNGSELVDENYAKAINEFLEIMAYRFCNPWHMFDFIHNRSSYQKKTKKTFETFFGLADHMVPLRKSEHLQRLKNKQDFESSGRKFKSFIDVLLENSVTEAGSLHTDDELKNLANNLLLAAFDTTIYEMLMILVCIGSHPDVQEKIYQEIIENLPDNKRLSKESLSQLPYLDAAIKESVRLYPIGAMIGRKATVDTQLRNVTIPAGANIVVHLRACNRNPKYWGPDAEEFKPERWLSPNTLPDHPAAFATFAPGRRGCVGKTYALTNMKATLIPMIRKYKLKADHTKLKLSLVVMLKPISGHLVELEPRSILKKPEV